MMQPEYEDYVKNGHKYRSVGVTFPGLAERFKLTPEQELIRKYKKEAMYE